MVIYLIIILMMIATYIPRVIPAIFISRLKFGPKTEKFLTLIPYTAMTALVFPGVMYIDGGNPWIGIAGSLAVIVLSLRRLPVAASIAGSIAVVMLLYAFL